MGEENSQGAEPSKPSDDQTKSQKRDGTETKPRHTENTQDIRSAVIVAIYTIVIFLVAILSLLAVWPRNSNELAMNATTTTRTVTFLFGIGGPSGVAMGPELILAATMVLAGVVGAGAFSLYAISLHLGPQQDFDKAWTGWYLLRPLVGAGLALIVYVLVRGGILSVGADLKDLNFLGFTGICFLVGLFAEHAMQKLNDLADTTFGKTHDESSRSKTEKDQGAKTATESVERKFDELLEPTPDGV